MENSSAAIVVLIMIAATVDTNNAYLCRKFTGLIWFFNKEVNMCFTFKFILYVADFILLPFVD